MSWAPFAEGKMGFFSNPVLTEIGKKYRKSSAQTALRYMIQSDIILIPKSTHIDRMQQNMDVFDFALDEKDMHKIESLNIEKSISPFKLKGIVGTIYYYYFKTISLF